MRATSSTRSRPASGSHRDEGAAAADVLGHLPVVIAEARHLRQMGDAQDLAAAREVAQLAAQNDRLDAADAGVDLVEHQRRAAALAVATDQLQREVDAGQLAARRHPLQRPQLLAGVGRERERHRVDAVLAELDRPAVEDQWTALARAPFELDLESRLGQREIGELAADPRRQRLRPRSPALRELDRGFAVPLERGGDLGFELAALLDAEIEVRALRAQRLEPSQHVAAARSVLAAQTLDDRQSVLDLGEPRGIGVDPLGLAAHGAGELLGADPDLLELRDPGRRVRLPFHDRLETRRRGGEPLGRRSFVVEDGRDQSAESARDRFVVAQQVALAAQLVVLALERWPPARSRRSGKRPARAALAAPARRRRPP